MSKERIIGIGICVWLALTLATAIQSSPHGIDWRHVMLVSSYMAMGIFFYAVSLIILP
jgi:hypothetical protein